MERIDKLIERFNDGELQPDERQELYNAFLNSDEVRQARPDHAHVIVPLALAAAGHNGKQQLAEALHPSRSIRLRRWSIAASITLILAVGTSATLFATQHRDPQTYCSNTALSDSEIDQWFNRTLATTI